MLIDHIRNIVILSLLALIIYTDSSYADDTDYARDIVPLLSKYCFDCHGDQTKPKGGLNLAEIKTAKEVTESTEIWKEVFAALRNKEMPPDGKLQPSDDERRLLLNWMATVLATPDLGGKRDPGQPVLRRITRLEYNNTVRDLLGLSTDLFMLPERMPLRKRYFDPASGVMPETLQLDFYEYGAKVPVFLRHAGLPGDNRAAHGFTNRGDSLSVSPLLIEKYLAVADEVAFHPDLAKEASELADLFPEVTVARTDAPSGRALTFQSKNKLAPDAPIHSIADGSAYTMDGFQKLLRKSYDKGLAGVFSGPTAEQNNLTVPGDSKNAIRIAVSKNRHLTITPTADLWFASFGSVQSTSKPGVIANKQPGQKLIELALGMEEDSVDEQIVAVGIVLLSRKDQSGDIRVTANYSDGTSTTLSHDLVAGSGVDNTFYSFAAPKDETIRSLRIDGSQFTGPYVVIGDLAFELTGRPIDTVQSSARKPVLQPNQKPIEARFRRFLERAFRRPVNDATVKLYLKPYYASLRSGASETEAIRPAIKAVLSSPEFLFLVESVAEEQGPVRQLNDYELASRLSYFLWSSMPDNELFELAAQGKLREPEVLEAQVKRMIKDPKVRELSESFAVQWLKLNELWAAQPDRQMFKTYYAGPQGKNTLAASLMGESLLLFETIMIEDRSILELISADYAYLNNRLIDHYGMAEALNEQLTKAGMTIPEELQNAKGPEANRAKQVANRIWLRAKMDDPNRGGVVTSGAVLTLTSLPNRTSPVKRGAWILETLFNRPPPEPTVAVDPLDDRRTADAGQTVRQKLEAHRANPSCMGCHSRIDPPGFALESLDPIGRWRDEDDGLPIDSRASFTDGRSFDGPAQFKEALLKDKVSFVRGFTEHMLSYALGRKLEHFDDATVDDIVLAMEKDDYRFSSVIVEIVKSYPFRHTRNLPIKESQ